MDEWMTAYGLTGRMERSAIPLTLMTTTLMDRSGGDGRMIYICPVCPWTVEYRTSELVASGVEDCALEVEQVLADHLRDPGCNWDFRSMGGEYSLRPGTTSVDRIHVDHELAGGWWGHAAGSMAASVCSKRLTRHETLWQMFLMGDLEADGWWS